MLDALIDWKDRNIPGSPQTSGVEQALEAGKDPHGPIRRRKHPIDEVRTGQVKGFARNRPALMAEQTDLVPQRGFDSPNSWSVRNTDT
jgi:hypothetical protein